MENKNSIGAIVIFKNENVMNIFERKTVTYILTQDFTYNKNIVIYIYLVRSEILTETVMKSSIFWDITPCSPLNVNRRFGGTCRFRLLGRRESQARISVKSGGKQHYFHAGFLLGLFLEPEDGRNMFLRNVSSLKRTIRRYGLFNFATPV
jgi:hypothetical protein